MLLRQIVTYDVGKDSSPLLAFALKSGTSYFIFNWTDKETNTDTLSTYVDLRKRVDPQNKLIAN